jgi:hypothetical protein
MRLGALEESSYAQEYGVTVANSYSARNRDVEQTAKMLLPSIVTQGARPGAGDDAQARRAGVVPSRERCTRCVL